MGKIMRLKDKVAIVTGGAHGMGEAEARLFATEGAKVIVADILGSDAERVAADIRAGGGEAAAAQIDVTSEAEWRDLIAKAVATYGRLDILVNNAGISGSSVGDPDGLEGWHRIIAVNQTSVFLGTKLAAEQMAKTGGGSIVNISSIMGFVGSASGHPAYHASKGAVRIYSKAAAEALASLLRPRPDFSLTWLGENMAWAKEVGERLLAGLRKAGLPAR